MPPQRSEYGVAPRIAKNSGRCATFSTAGVKDLAPQERAWFSLK